MAYRRPQKGNLTDRLMHDELDEARIEQRERFGSRSRDAQASKMLRTALLRVQEQANIDIESLPIGQVIQVYSLYSEVELDGRTWLCVVRKTMAKLAESAVLVGDLVRVRDLGINDESGRPQAVIEQILPRKSILTRADSFKAIEQHPIVANADQMLIVASARDPHVRWGLIDRMLVAAQSGGLKPIICLNKIDLLGPDELADVQQFLSHYESLGIATVRSSVSLQAGVKELRDVLLDRTTVLAGHSGVGKSSLLNMIQPGLNVRTGQISNYTGKGRHTTSSARRYALECGGAVIDTPGVKLFGLWNVSNKNLIEYFPDVAAGNAPEWRQHSYQRMAESLG